MESDVQREKEEQIVLQSKMENEQEPDEDNSAEKRASNKEEAEQKAKWFDWIKLEGAFSSERALCNI